MTSLRVVTRMFCAAAETATAPVKRSRWEALKNSKAVVWCRSLLSDYKEACKDVVVGAWERPLKATLYMTTLGGACVCAYTKPDQSSFDAVLLERSNQLGLLSPWIRNGASDGHVQSLMKLRNEGRLRQLSLGMLSLIYSADYDPQSTLYEAQCSNLSMPWLEFPQRVLDVGFVGRWWILDSKMQDYDVNQDEFKHLPASMQTTSPPSVQEVERNEKLHEESWLPLRVEEEEKKEPAADQAEERVGQEHIEEEKNGPAADQAEERIGQEHVEEEMNGFTTDQAEETLGQEHVEEEKNGSTTDQAEERFGQDHVEEEMNGSTTDQAEERLGQEHLEEEKNGSTTDQAEERIGQEHVEEEKNGSAEDQAEERVGQEHLVEEQTEILVLEPMIQRSG